MAITSPPRSSVAETATADPVGVSAVIAPLDYSQTVADRRTSRIAWCILLYFTVPFARSIVQLYVSFSELNRHSSLYRSEPLWLVVCDLAAAVAVGFLIFAAIRALITRGAAERLLFTGTLILMVVSTLDASAKAFLEVFYDWFSNGRVVWTILDGTCDVAAAAVPPVILLIVLRGVKSSDRPESFERRV